MNQKKRRERITSSEAKEAYKEASKFFLDIAKLVFAGVILASVMNMSEFAIASGTMVIIAAIVAICATIYERNRAHNIEVEQ